MGQFTAEQRTFIVLHYNRTQSLAAVQNAFRERFPDRIPPTKTTILKNFRKYCNHGTSLNRNKNNSGRPVFIHKNTESKIYYSNIICIRDFM